LLPIDIRKRRVVLMDDKDGNYVIHPYTENDTVPVHVLEGCTVNLPEVFEDY